MDDFSAGYAVGRDSNNGGSNGWGNDGSIFWWVIVFALIFGWGRGGFGGFGGGEGGAQMSGILTRSDLCQDMSFQDVKNGVRNIEDSVNLGFSNLNSTICNQQYDTARMINALDTTVLQGFNQTNITNLQGFNGVQSQLASCCCDIERGQERIAYGNAQNTAAIISAGQANTQRILDYLCTEKISALQAENAQLQNTISQQAQSSYIISALAPKTPIPAYPVFPTTSFAYPTGVTFGVNPYSNGCGCNSGCGCGSAL